MPNVTPRYGFYLPLVADAIDEDLWGGYLNDNFDLLDGILNGSDTAVVNLTPYNVAITDASKTLLVDATSSSITIALPAAATAGDGFILAVKKTDSSSNSVIIDTDGSETIDGVSTLAMGIQYQTVFIVCDGSNWFIRDNYIRENTVSVSSTPYTGSLRDLQKTLLVDATSALVTINLISAVTATAGFEMTVKKTDSTVNTVILDGASTETIDGSLTYILTTQYDSVTIVSDGTNWYVKSTKGTNSAFTKSFTSSDQTITSGGTLTLAHGLGITPKLFQCYLKNVTSDLGYTTGDITPVNNNLNNDTGNGRGQVITSDATNIYITFGSVGGGSYLILNKSNGNGGASIVNSSWSFFIRAWA